MQTPSADPPHESDRPPGIPAERRIVVLSDVHLSQTHPDGDGDAMWMRYRRKVFQPDPDFARLVDVLLAEHGDDAIELVFNGDVLDFDAPWVKDGKSSFDEFPLTEQGCAEHTARILGDHPVWFDATARVLLHGHRVMFLCGNHDIELCWPGVRAVIREDLERRWAALWAAAERAGNTEGLHPPAALSEKVRFRTWFHVTEDGIYIEHGSQYDHLNNVRYAMLPYTKDRSRVHPVFGNQAFKRTGSRMGYFNPYYEETFYMGAIGYLHHFATHYATSDRHIIRTWLLGMLRTAAEIWEHRHFEDWTTDMVHLAQEETGASEEAILATHALTTPTGEHTMLPLLREAWLDRVGLLAFMGLVTATAALLSGGKGALITAGVLAALFVVYEVVTPKPDLRTNDSAPPEVKNLWHIHDAVAICMGHTHRPFSHWEESVDPLTSDQTPDPRRARSLALGGFHRFHGNSGSWCPAFHDQECTKPVLDGRPFLMLWTDARGVHGGLHWLRGGAVQPDPEGVRQPQ
jgi:UDP-2,3-diacylglucosamine pyrophosphatase LpxH